MHFVYGNEAFGLRTNVDNYTVAVDADDRPLNDLASPQ
jgi:hypothetical protein